MQEGLPHPPPIDIEVRLSSMTIKWDSTGQLDDVRRSMGSPVDQAF